VLLARDGGYIFKANFNSLCVCTYKALTAFICTLNGPSSVCFLLQLLSVVLADSGKKAVPVSVALGGDDLHLHDTMFIQLFGI